MDRIRVYHPETDEFFDLPPNQATDLILNHGWRQQPIDHKVVAPAAKPAPEPEIPADWRERMTADSEAVEDKPKKK